MDAIKEVVVYLGILRHTAQQLVDQLAHTETHRMATGFVGLRREESRKITIPNSLGGKSGKREERDMGLRGEQAVMDHRKEEKRGQRKWVAHQRKV